MANAYAEIAVQFGTGEASRVFLADYMYGKTSNAESLFLYFLVPEYIGCKRGEITRVQCAAAQREFFDEFLGDENSIAEKCETVCRT